MIYSDEPVRVRDTKKSDRLQEILKKLDQAEVIARGLGIAHHEIARLKEEGLRELNRKIHW